MSVLLAQAHLFSAAGGVKSAEQIELLVVAGGGGGGGSDSPASRVAGGGGAGGYLYYSTHNLAGSPLQISVGTGGARGTSSPTNLRGSNGTPSTFGSVTTVGGGGGGTGQYPGFPSNGNPGGSGGGAGHDPSQNYPYQGGGSGVGGQGSKGGDGDFRGGGGGGATGRGLNNGPNTSDSTPYGGSGQFNSITGAPVGYAGGGSAGNNPTSFPSGQTYGSYGEGAGGGSNSPGHDALDGTGSGGGGSGSPRSGGNGAPGIVIIAYPTDFKELTIPGGLSYTTPSRSGMYVYRFTSGSGTVSF